MLQKRLAMAAQMAQGGSDDEDSKIDQKPAKLIPTETPVDHKAKEEKNNTIKLSKDKVLIIVEDEQELKIKRAIQKALGQYLDDLSSVETASDFNVL